MFVADGTPFQGACALASLKQPALQRSGTGSPFFPGRMRPGLIEAPTHPWTAFSHSTFQGACALASLKHYLARRRVRGGRAFQGACALASLKHGLGRRAAVFVDPPFQGACALASLKRGCDVRRSVAPLLPFQGACALASLKRRRAGSRARTAVHFPGRMRPGLIEARTSCHLQARRLASFQGACALASLKPRT